MGLFFKSKKYDDGELCLTAERAIREHPILKDITNISVLSEDGEVQILGQVNSSADKKRITKTIKSKFKRSSKNYKAIENKLKIR
ncbi:MAG: hypothetical protein ACOCRL_02245 [Bacillota bacterium]